MIQYIHQDGLEDTFGFGSSQEEDICISEPDSTSNQNTNVDVADPAVSVKNLKIGDDWNAGFLQKMSCKSGNLLKRRWRTRWFAMQGTILKYYRKRPAETTNTAG